MAWEAIEKAISTARDRTIGVVFKSLAAAKARRDETTFSIALIALSAKIAKADGVVTDDEISAFQDYFEFPAAEAGRVRMVYQLAQEDVAGFDHYLRQVADLFHGDPVVLEDVLDCLYHVALADGVAHPQEMAMLEQAGEAFGLCAAAKRRISAAHIGVADDDPYLILGIEPDASAEAVKAAYRQLARDHHPDALASRGVPASMVKIAEGRMAAINDAYAQLQAQH